MLKYAHWIVQIRHRYRMPPITCSTCAMQKTLGNNNTVDQKKCGSMDLPAAPLLSAHTAHTIIVSTFPVRHREQIKCMLVLD